MHSDNSLNCINDENSLGNNDKSRFYTNDNGLICNDDKSHFCTTDCICTTDIFIVIFALLVTGIIAILIIAVFAILMADVFVLLFTLLTTDKSFLKY